MSRTNTKLVVGNNWGKGGVEKPGVLKAENRATRSFGGGRKVKRSVVEVGRQEEVRVESGRAKLHSGFTRTLNHKCSSSYP
jgi:hypothetical protein